MSLITKQPEGIPAIPGDTYQGICYSVIDIGTHHSDLYDKDIPQVIITWELPDLRIDIEKEGKKVNLPRAISKTYTNSLGEQATLYAHLVGWRGAEFTQKELDAFDLKTILTKNCLLTVANSLNQKGKTVAKVTAVSKLMKGIKAKQPENKIISFDMNDGITNIPEGLPDWVKEQIKTSIEYKAVMHAKSSPELNDAQKALGVANTDEEPDKFGTDVDVENDIPF